MKYLIIIILLVSCSNPVVEEDKRIEYRGGLPITTYDNIQDAIENGYTEVMCVYGPWRIEGVISYSTGRRFEYSGISAVYERDIWYLLINDGFMFVEKEGIIGFSKLQYLKK